MNPENRAENQPVLMDIKDLTVTFTSSRGLIRRKTQRVRVLDHLNLQIYAGETLGVVGESGCGKSTLANSIIRLVEPTGGQIIYRDADILQLDKAGRRRLRRHMQMVFQNPHSSLNPRMTVFNLVSEPLRTHTDMSGQEMESRVVELLENVGLGTEHLTRYPHQLSGGQAQRVVIARALALSPALLLLDEPTSALDVSVQAQIINLLVKLQKEHDLTYLFISHDLGVVQHISDRIAVMYLGEIVELAPSETIFDDPQHPYTQALLSATLEPDPEVEREYIILKGNVPSPANPPSGCRFHPRCPLAFERCAQEAPVTRQIASNHWASCHLLDKAANQPSPEV